MTLSLGDICPLLRFAQEQRNIRWNCYGFLVKECRIGQVLHSISGRKSEGLPQESFRLPEKVCIMKLSLLKE